ncbi:MAG TPA: phosphate ABC transporter permease PstA [Microbacteriaceae bacterium]|nr:phosphate ABC transporter permease PstA [Microbacteriaceae bacterium]
MSHTPNTLTAGRLAPAALWGLLAASLAVSTALFGLIAASNGSALNIIGLVVAAGALYLAASWAISRVVEGRRRALDRLMTAAVTAAFLLALVPLISLAVTAFVNGLARFDATFFTWSMRNVVGAGGGALAAIVGTLFITGAAIIISVPIGLMTAIYLVEYGTGRMARIVTFLVDVMTGIPSIVAGLFAYALLSLVFQDPGYRAGFGGAIALSLLMIPVVVRSTEEMLRLVPSELREASLALGVPKWRTIVKVVLPTAVAGIVTGVMISISRIIGETAPLLLVAGATASMNYNLFAERMMTLPVFVYTQYMNQGTDSQAYIDRAWTGALTLILIVALLNIGARIIAKLAAPKGER